MHTKVNTYDDRVEPPLVAESNEFNYSWTDKVNTTTSKWREKFRPQAQSQIFNEK
jgi:hypothetical protein